MSNFKQKIVYYPIGIIHSSLKPGDKIPRQSKFSDISGRIEINEKYLDALKDLEEYEYIHCISHLNGIRKPVRLQSSTPWDDEIHGIFSIRTPARPNPIALSILKLLDVKSNILYVSNLDLLDGTPVLDIKPFIPFIDNRKTSKVGFVSEKMKKKK